MDGKRPRPREIVSLVELKRTARTLPETSTVRRILLQEPDLLGRGTYLDRAEVVVRAIYAEIDAAKAAATSEPSLRRVAETVVRLGEPEAT